MVVKKKYRKMISLLCLACTLISLSPINAYAARHEKKSERTSLSTEQSESASAVLYLEDGQIIEQISCTATERDESVLAACGDITASVCNALIQKISGEASSADASSFQGVNAAVRVYGSASVTLKDCDISADAGNATGVFAYENGTIYMDHCTVNVTGGGAGGIQVAGGGTLIGSDLTVCSASKAAIRSDRGGGTMVLDGGTYTSTGSNGCPSIYSTADITVYNAECVSESSRAVIIEGKNTVTLENCTLSGNDQSSKEGSVKANVLLYQSASGDASPGTSIMTVKNCSMTSQNGAMFYCTNTDSIINLKDSKFVLPSDSILLIASAGRWGKEGGNGGNCILNAEKQLLEGKIAVDSISSVELNLASSSYRGEIQSDGRADVVLDESSSWVLTGDSYITSLSGNTDGLILNGYSLYINGTAYSA